MSFQTQHPNYKSYHSDKYHVLNIPKQIFSELQGVILKAASKSGNRDFFIKEMVRLMAENIPCEAGEAWSGSFLLDELGDYARRLSKAKFCNQMDFFLSLANKKHIDIIDLNNSFESHDFGYEIVEYETGLYQSEYEWQLKPDITESVESIEDTINTVQQFCKQTCDHLIQAKQQLSQDLSDRDLKDAIRDCLSAMEACVKKLTNKNDIKEATKVFRSNSNIWGKDEVVKEGLSIWDRMHNLYPDIRHGNPHSSDLSFDEALYWVERITSYVRYITKIHLKNNP